MSTLIGDVLVRNSIPVQRVRETFPGEVPFSLDLKDELVKQRGKSRRNCVKGTAYVKARNHESAGRWLREGQEVR